jgi:hypothetical protein
MARREVTHSRKDEEGDITALCNLGAYWSPRRKQDAINDIEQNSHNYFVRVKGQDVDVHVVDGLTGKYLRTDPDKTTRNNLDDLPEC